MTVAHRTGIVVLAAVLVSVGLLVAPTPASAEDTVNEGLFGFVATAHLEGDPYGDEGCMGGVALGLGTGVDHLLVGTVPGLTNGVPNFGASFYFANPNILVGDAVGNLWIDGLGLTIPPLVVDDVDVNADFAWAKLGQMLLWSLEGDNEYGAAVAVITPVEPALFDCAGRLKGGPANQHGSWAIDAHHQVVGVGVITQ